MGEPVRIDLYCEDRGHEQFARALLGRLAGEMERRPALRTASGRGGHGRALAELKAWQRAVSVGAAAASHDLPDLLVVLIDANCSGWSQARRSLEQAIERAIFPRFAIGCPDPHVERWCLADPVAVQAVLGIPAPADPGKCERQVYKKLLRQTILEAGQPILTSEMEYAPELVAAMDLYRAGKNQPSLRHFIEEIRAALQGIA